MDDFSPQFTAKATLGISRSTLYRKLKQLEE
nr:helix-turn-helix domain-containing protein [Marinobacterium profundum]